MSPLGKRQAQAVAEALAQEGIQAIHASPLSRALETAQAIAQPLGLPIVIDDRLKEIHAGIFQGLLREELAQRHPREAQAWYSLDPDFRIPGGESRRDLMRRGAEVLRAVRDAGHERAAVVSHGGLLSAAVKELLGVPAERRAFHFYNAAFCRLLWNDDVVIDTFNEREHLRHLGCAGFGDL